MFILRFIVAGSYFIVADILLSRYVNFIMQIIALIVLSFPTTIFFYFIREYLSNKLLIK